MTVPNKIIYIARHGQTVANIENEMQGLNDPLTPEGEIQAEHLAGRASNLDFDVIIASDAVRARTTAEVIAKRTGHALEASPLFQEAKAPTSLIGMRRGTPQHQKYAQFSREHIHTDDHFEDEENFLDLRNRGIEAIEFLEKRKEEKIFVVTHGMFLRVMTALIIMNKTLELDVWFPFNESLRTENTGLSIWRLEDRRWRLITWNDHAHLG